MWLVLYFVLSCSHLMVKGFGNEEILGKGKWRVLSHLECEDPEQYEVKFELSKRKINRTHDAFSADIELDRELNVTYAVEIVANKEVDGGFKFFQRITDESFCNWLSQYTGNNWEQILTMAKVDPPQCPISAGKYSVEDFVVDYQQFESFDALYGTYDASLYVVYLGQRMSCVRALLRYEKYGEDDDDDDDEYV